MTAASILISHNDKDIAQGLLNLLKSADGSAKWTSSDHANDDTQCTAITAVNGPIEVRIKEETVGKATLEFQIYPSHGLTSPQERFMEELISRALESVILLGLRPRSQIIITSQIVAPLSSSIKSKRYYTEEVFAGSAGLQVKRESLMVISTLVNSISMALLDANYAMNSVLASSTVSTSAISAVLVFAFPSEELVLLESVGAMASSDLPGLLEEGLVSARSTYATIRQALTEQVERSLRWQM